MSTISNDCNGVCNGTGSLSGNGLLLFGLIKSRYIGITGTSDYYSLSFRERVFAVYLNEFDRDCECVRRCLAHGGDVEELMDYVCFGVCSLKMTKGCNAYLNVLCPQPGYHFHYMVDESSLAIFFKYDGIDVAGVKEWIKSRCLLFAKRGDYRFLSEHGVGVNDSIISFWNDLDEDLKWQWLRRGCRDFDTWCNANVRRDYFLSLGTASQTYKLRDGREFSYSRVI